METTHADAVIINVVAVDRHGIVAAISAAVSGLGGNIDACSQTVVGQYFTLIMIASFPRSVDHETLRNSIRGHGEDLNVLVLPYAGGEVNAPASGSADGENFIFTAIGGDREGITAKFSSLMADRDINIVDLYGTRQDGNFILIGKICIPPGWDIEILKAELQHAADAIGHSVRLQHENVFVATNQITPPHARAGKSARVVND